VSNSTVRLAAPSGDADSDGAARANQQLMAAAMRVMAAHLSGGDAGDKKNAPQIEWNVLFRLGNNENTVVVDARQLNERCRVDAWQDRRHDAKISFSRFTICWWRGTSATLTALPMPR